MAEIREPGDDPALWQAWLRETAAKWKGRGHPPADAARLAFGEAVNLIHSRRPARIEDGVCAGCGKEIASEAVLALPDGSAVCGNALVVNACLSHYGARWRSAAAAALAKLGIAVPEGWTP